MKDLQHAEQRTTAAATEQQTGGGRALNGVDVEQYNQTVEAVREQPEIGKFRFRAANRWVSGGNNLTVVDDFYGAGEEHEREKPFTIEMDEPPLLLGTDRGPNPVESALAALAGCLTTTLVFHAAAQGVRLDEVESRLEGGADLRGFMGLDETVRNGLDKIRVSFRVKADAPREKIRQLVELAQKRSGVFDMLNNGVPISVELTQTA